MSQPHQDDQPTLRAGPHGPASTEARAAVARDILKNLDYPTTLDAPFGETLLREALITREQLSTAIEAQGLMKGAGVPMRLGQVLVAKGMLTPDQVKQVLALLGKTVLHCPACGKNYNVKNWRPGVAVSCPACSVALTPPPVHRTLDAHATKILPPEVKDDEKAAGGKPFGRYRLLEKLGQGGMGVVWKAWDTQLKRVVALKQILAKEGVDQEQIERFMREAQLAAKLRHPNIIAVYDVGIHEGQHYFTTEYVAGQSIEEALKGRVALKQLLGWVKEVADALAYAHEQGVIHRDVKPANVLVDGHGKAFVMDFGLAKDVDLSTKEGARRATLTAEGAVMGTPMYMSPEQACGRTEALGPATDQFSLGVMLYQMLTKRLPFAGRSLGELFIAIMHRDPVAPSRISPRTHRDVETICLKALEKDPQRRYASMADLAADLGRYLDGEAILARPISGMERLWRTIKKRRAAVIPSAAAAVLAIGFSIWFIAKAHEHSVAVADGLASGTRMESEGSWDKARDAYQAVLAIDEENRRAREGYDRSVSMLKEAEERLKAGREQAEAAKTSQDEAMKLLEAGRPAIELARRYRYSRDMSFADVKEKLEAARKLFEEAVAKAPEIALGHYLLGRSWELLGSEEDAEACWGKAIQADPKFAPARFRLGMLKLDQAEVSQIGIFADESRLSSTSHLSSLVEEAKRELEVARGLPIVEDEPFAADQLEVALAHASGDLVTMRSLCSSALQKHGDKEGCEHFYLALIAHGRGDSQEPDWLQHAVSICPHDRYLLLRRITEEARDRTRPGSVDLAITMCTELISEAPRFAAALSMRGMLYLLKADPCRALSEADAACKAAPRSIVALAARAMAKVAGGDLDGAIADYSAILSIQPNLQVALASRAKARLSKNDLKGAFADAEDALRVSPGYSFALAVRGGARRAQGDLDGALADYEQALKDRPGDWMALYGRAGVRHDRGDLDGAIADYTEAIKNDPTQAEGFYNRGRVRGDKEDWDGAIADDDEALKLRPGWPEAITNRGLCRMGKGDFDAALVDFDEALRIKPSLVEALSNRGFVRNLQGDRDGAIADLEKALKFAPKGWSGRSQVEELLRTIRQKATMPSTASAPAKVIIDMFVAAKKGDKEGFLALFDLETMAKEMGKTVAEAELEVLGEQDFDEAVAQLPPPEMIEKMIGAMLLCEEKGDEATVKIGSGQIKLHRMTDGPNRGSWLIYQMDLP